MFIKRINNIYAPTLKLQQPKSNPSPNKTHIKQLKLINIQTDPHGRLIAMYSELYDEVYIISILTLMDYIAEHRLSYSQDLLYSFKTYLTPEVTIVNPRPSLHIFQIKLSNNIQNTQFLIIIYYTGIIDIYSILSGKKIDTIDITTFTTENNQILNHIYNVNIIGHSVFISTFDGTLLCYQGRQLTICKGNIGQWVRIGYDYEILKEQQKKGGKKSKRVPVFYDFEGSLKIGSKVLQQGFSLKTKQKKRQITDSYEQFLKYENQKFSTEGISKKFFLSQCERYLLCINEKDLIINQRVINPFYYTIRSKKLQWNILPNIFFGHLPAINHFWGLESCSVDKNKKGRNFVDRCLIDQSILIAVIGDQHEYLQTFIENNVGSSQKQWKKIDDGQQGQKKGEKSISIVRILQLENKYVIQNVCKVQNIKHKVTSLNWIGFTQLVYLDQNNNTYYLEINEKIIFH